MKQKKTGVKKDTPVAAPVHHHSKWRPLIIAGVIAFITLLCLLAVCKNSFINWDDNIYIFENDQLSRPLGDAFVHFFQLHYFLGAYTPVTMFVYALVAHGAGIEPAAFHTVSLGLHLVNVLLVFWFIYLLSGRRLWVASIVALMFGIHPMHVESVAWAAELKDVLYSAFFIGGLISYLKYLHSAAPAEGEPNKANASKFYLITFVLFILSVLSKPSAVTFPVVLLLLDFFMHRGNSGRLWLEKLPFIAIAIVIGIITLRGQSTYELMQDHHTFLEKLVLASYAFLDYFRRLLVPAGLSIYYPYPVRAGGHLPHVYFIAPVAVVALCYLVYRTLKHNRYVAFGFLFFVVNILLVLQVVSSGLSITADHYTYLPYIGLFFIIAMAFDRIWNHPPPKLRAYGQPVLVVLVAFFVACAYLSYARCAVWKNEETIADDLIEKYPQEPVALNNKGFVLYFLNRNDEAKPYFEKAVQLRPDYVFAYVNLANIYVAARDYAGAMTVTDAALTKAPPSSELYITKGYILLLQNNLADAIKAYSKATDIKKDSRNAYVGMAECYYRMKDYASEISILDKGLKQLPGNYLLLNYKGYALFLMGKYPEAERCFVETLKSKPGFEAAQVNLANCRKAMTGQKP